MPEPRAGDRDGRDDTRIVLGALNIDAETMRRAAREEHRTSEERADLTRMADEASDLARRIREGSTWLTSR